MTMAKSARAVDKDGRDDDRAVDQAWMDSRLSWIELAERVALGTACGYLENPFMYEIPRRRRG